MPIGYQTGVRINRVGACAGAGLLVLLAGLLGRVAQLQLAPGEDLRPYLQQRVSTSTELPVRGDLLDRRGRVLSGTQFGQRLVIDPTLLPSPPDGVIVALACAIGEPEEKVGVRIVKALEENERRAAARPGKPLPAVLTAQVLLARLLGTTGPDATEPVKTEADDLPDDGKGPIRYLPVGGVISDERGAAVRALRVRNEKGKEVPIPGVMLERRPVREYPGGGEVAALVGRVGFEGTGLMGIEHRLEKRLAGEAGSVSYARDAEGRPLWMEPGQVKPSRAGEDVTLSIDLELQRMAYEELLRGVDDADAAGGRLVIADPASGEVLAMVDIVRRVPGAVEYPWVSAKVKGTGLESPPGQTAPGGKRYITIHEDAERLKHPELMRNRCVEDVYEPGSTFKPFVWSTITELGLAKPDEVIDTEGGTWVAPPHRVITDVTRRASMTWSYVLINSSNIGMIKGAQRLSYGQLHDAVVRFGFGKPTGLLRMGEGAGLGGEASGIVTPMKRWSVFSQVSVAYGHEVAVTPVQMVRGFSAFARTGSLAGTLPTLRLTAVAPGEIGNGVLYRVIPTAIADLTRQTMRGVTASMEARLADQNQGGTGETGWLYEIFGKSGTAEIPLGKPPKGKRRPRGSSGYFDDQYNSSFIAGGPVENPRLVVLVVIDDPGIEKIRVKHHYGTWVAGPVVRRVMDRALMYLGVPPAPKPVVSQLSQAE